MGVKAHSILNSSNSDLKEVAQEAEDTGVLFTNFLTQETKHATTEKKHNTMNAEDNESMWCYFRCSISFWFNVQFPL